MKHLFFSFLLLPSLLFAQGNQLKTFSLKGNVKGLPDGEVTLKTPDQSAQVLATTAAKGGVFTLKGAIPETGLYVLQFPTAEPQYVFLESKNGSVDGSFTDLHNLKYQGMPAENDFQEFNRIFNPLIAQLNDLARKVQAAGEGSQQGAAAMQQYNATVAKVRSEVGNFVGAHKASVVSAFLLSITTQLSENIGEMEERFNQLSPEAQASNFGKNVKDYIASSKIGAVGTDALDFTQNDINGNPVTLSSFRGKYVLVDFWASWCRPCRMENPNVVKAYDKFKNKNFTILGVSLDQNKDSWMKAVKDDKLAWNHVSDLQQWGNAVAQLYHVQSIPQNFLIDPNGKIIAKDLRAGDLERKLCEVLGCN